MKKIFTLIIFLFGYTWLFGQRNQVDSLIRLLPKEKTDTGKVIRLIEIGRMFAFVMEKNDSGSVYLQQAVDLSKKINDTYLEADATFQLATNFHRSANDPNALVLSLQNIKRLERLKTERNSRPISRNGSDYIFYQTRLLAAIYDNIGDYEKQLEYVKKMKSIYYSTLAQQPAISVNYNLTINFNLANAYNNLKMYDSSYHYTSLLYRETLQKGDAQWLALASNALAEYYEMHTSNDSAMMLSRKSMAPAIESKRLDIVIDAELRIGKIFQKKGKIDSAFYYSLLALNEVLKIDNPKRLSDVYKQLSELYNENKQLDSAYKYLKDFTVLNDSLQDQSKIAEAQNFAFNQTLNDQQLEQAKKEAGQQLKTKIRFYILAGVIAFILFATFWLLRNLQQKRKINILLTQQKEEVQNSLLALKETQTQLIQSEKMASLGELTAGIAHEIQNPLNFVNNFSDLNKELLVEMKDEMNKGNLADANEIANNVIANEEKINHHGKRADGIVKGMLQHSQSSTGQKEATDINVLCDEYLRLSYHGLRAKDKNFNATIKTDFDNSIGNINIIPQDIGRVILNLINNAFYEVAEKSRSQPEPVEGGLTYQPTVSISTKKISDKVEIKVADNGNGIPQNIVDKIFQPFFTTKPTGQGTGLGLSLSYDIVKAHSGELIVETVDGEGTTFIISLPANNK